MCSGFVLAANNQVTSVEAAQAVGSRCDLPSSNLPFHSVLCVEPHAHALASRYSLSYWYPMDLCSTQQWANRLCLIPAMHRIVRVRSFSW